MNRFRMICHKDVRWRTQEIALIRKSTALLGISDGLRIVLLRYAVPALYAVWEGFVTFVLSECAKKINGKRILVRHINVSIVRYDMWEKFQIANLPTYTDKQVKALVGFYSYFRGRLKLSTDIRTNSNVDFNELKRLLGHYAAVIDDDDKYEERLSKFLNYRNCIAHGNKDISVNDELIQEFSGLILQLMDKVVECLDDVFRMKRYLESPLDSFLT